jgi:hypothetical protein
MKGISSAYGFKCLFAMAFLLFLHQDLSWAQSCDYQTGTVTFQSSGGINTDLYIIKYVLTDQQGLIRGISEETQFDILAAGLYSIYGVSYKINTDIQGLEEGDFISNVYGDCLDIGDPFTFTVCEEIDACNYCLGEEISLNVSGGNEEPGFITRYFLTSSDGSILLIQDTPVFVDLDEGLYVAFAINFDEMEGVTGFEVGNHISQISGVCKDISEGYVIGICQGLQPTIFFDLKGCDITQTALLQVGEVYDSYLWSTGATSSFIIVPADVVETYSVTVSLSSGCSGIAEQPIRGTEIATIGDFVFADANGNGIQDVGESGLNGVTVNLYADFNRDGRPDIPGFPSCTTTTGNHPDSGAPGYYIFHVYQSNYVVEFVSPSGFELTVSNQGGDDDLDSDANQDGFTGSIGVVGDQHITNIDAGLVTTSSMCGTVWYDDDGDGFRDDDEEGINDVTVRIFDSGGALIDTAITAADMDTDDGSYCFDNLVPGDYFIQVLLPDGFVFSPAEVTSDESRDSDVNEANGAGTTSLFTLGPGDRKTDIGAGIYQGGTICGIVWQDVQGSTANIYDPGVDALLSMVEVDLLSIDLDQTVSTIETDENGAYCFESVPVGSYAVMIGAPGSLSYVEPNVGNDEMVDSDVSESTGRTDVFFVRPSDTIQGLNAGVKFGTLPVELLSFSGYWDKQRDLNQLTWETAAEVNNEKFEIYRAEDEIQGSFELIGSVEGAGNSSQQIVYDYEDRDIGKSGNYYYRLKQIDYDGQFEYSDIIVIQVERNGILGIEAYPNPASRNVNLRFQDLLDNSSFSARLMDIQGRLINHWQALELQRGTSTIPISLGSLGEGQYLLQVQIGTQQKMIILQVIE